MQVDLSKVMLQLEGAPFQHQFIDKEGVQAKKDLTVKEVMLNGLLNAQVQNESGEDKFKRYQLAQRVHAANGSVELGTAEVELVKRLVVTYGYQPQVYGQFVEAVDPPPAKGA